LSLAYISTNSYWRDISCISPLKAGYETLEVTPPAENKPPDNIRHKRNFDKNGEGEGASRPWSLETLIKEEVTLEIGGNWFEPVTNIYIPVSPSLNQYFIFNSANKKYSYV
jgi:hypothetical protein